MSFSAAILLLSPATTRSLSSSPYLLLSLPPPPQILTLVEMEAGWGHGTSSVIFKIKDFFFVTLPSSPSQWGLCLSTVSAIPTDPQLWAAELENLDSPTVLFTYLTPTPQLKTTLLCSFLPRQGLSCPYPNPAPGNMQEETPFRSGEQLGRCGGRGEGGLSAVTPARKGDTRVP